MSRAFSRSAVLAIAAAGLATSSASAAVIFEGGGWRIEAADGLVNNVSVFPDFVSGNLLVIEKFATFRSVSQLTGLPDSILLTFTQIASDANTATRIAIADESVSNQTGLDWTEFVISLQGPAAFNQGLSAGFSTDTFSTLTFPTATEAVFSGGVVQDGFTWFPGQAAGELVWDVDLSGDSPVVFTLKELPIPTPAAGALAMVAGGFFAGRRRR